MAKGADKMKKATKAANNLSKFMPRIDAASAEPERNAGKRQRGKGETVAITVRLPKDAWMKLQMFAMSEGTSLQSLAVSGLNRELAAKGQPPLDV